MNRFPYPNAKVYEEELKKRHARLTRGKFSGHVFYDMDTGLPVFNDEGQRIDYDEAVKEQARSRRRFYAIRTEVKQRKWWQFWRI